MLANSKNMSFKRRDDEPEYARLPEVDAPKVNQYGKAIDLLDSADRLAGKSLNINAAPGVSKNPNRYKQHGFYFNADNCISCHACESACSEKNDLPPHLAFRSVGYVEGGTWPDYHRMNISMACNHCDDPVCLKGCPTRAYTKFAEYGAVLQDPDICFGCGYCTWVCPYNAPQLDPVNGQVEKCNMCVDRLEVGLKPACSSACLAGALDFGVIETLPENREQLETSIPGFPTPDITHPNIRFQQKKTLPRKMTRPDSMPLVYERNEMNERGAQGSYQPKVKSGSSQRDWNLAALSSRENPLVIFTLLSQATIGAFVLAFLAPMFGVSMPDLGRQPLAYQALLFILLGMQGFALLMSTIHLGKPFRFYRGFNNLRHSPVSREAATLMLFFTALGIHFLSLVIPYWFEIPVDGWGMIHSISGWTAVIAGPISLYFMHRIYRIKARPFWNHWQVLTSFYGTMLSLGSVALFLFLLVANFIILNNPLTGFLNWLVLPVLLGTGLEMIGLFFHARYLNKIGGEGSASHAQQRTRFGKTYILRNVFFVAAMSLLAIAYLLEAGWIVVAAASLFVVAASIIGRALFYVLVIPTTMPGAFFWRNKGFQEHARETGLANLPQVGVVPDSH